MFGTLFVSAPLYASLRLGEDQIREHTAKVESGSFKDAEDADEAEKAQKSEDSAEVKKATEKPAKKPARVTIEIHRVNLNG